jgi:uncharacterized protein YggU (UPF0235/DUF167 family)
MVFGMKFGIHVKPGASQTSIGGTYGDLLLVKVKERAVDSAANDALIPALAGAFGVSSTCVSIHSGRRSKTKIIHIDGDEGTLRAKLQNLLMLNI